ncbi:DUF2961 domain-containing protein [Pseudonocardia sp. CA-107938]|uniref:DUF2961 domain-containing protein n=1 Tax=Pseudonocardia sp. CA-107938 TaxID=3240021 RepID=UPI003D920B47
MVLPPSSSHEHVDLGSGSYLGTYIAPASLHRYWWGEGEVTFFIHDDEEYPDPVQHRTEDYAGGMWAF